MEGGRKRGSGYKEVRMVDGQVLPSVCAICVPDICSCMYLAWHIGIGASHWYDNIVSADAQEFTVGGIENC